MKNNFLLIIAIWGFILFPITSLSEMIDRALYINYTGTPQTFAWDASVGAEYYIFELYSFERKTVVIIGNTSQTQIVITPPFSGHFIPKVKSCKQEAGSELCSEYAESTDAARAKVDGQPRAWWIYQHIAPPGDSTIEY